MGKRIELEHVYRPDKNLVRIERVAVTPAKMAPLPVDARVTEIVAKDVSAKKPQKIKKPATKAERLEVARAALDQMGGGVPRQASGESEEIPATASTAMKPKTGRGRMPGRRVTEKPTDASSAESGTSAAPSSLGSTGPSDGYTIVRRDKARQAKYMRKYRAAQKLKGTKR